MFIIVLSAILSLMYFVLFSLVYSSHGIMASIRQIRERHKEEDPKNKTPVLKNQPVSVLLWRELHYACVNLAKPYFAII